MQKNIYYIFLQVLKQVYILIFTTGFI